MSLKPGDTMMWLHPNTHESIRVRLVEPEYPEWWVVRADRGAEYFAHTRELSPCPPDTRT